MIEDLEMAILWLSLVTVRLVQAKRGGRSVKQNGQTIIEDTQTAGTGTSPSSSSSGNNSNNNDVRLRRDAVSGRLILDIYLPTVEARAVQEALSELVEFQYHGRTFTDYDQAQASTSTASATQDIDNESSFGRSLAKSNSGKNFAVDSATFGKLFLAPLQQLQSPNVSYSAGETEPDVLAVSELCGVLFTQGVNAWQTWAHVTLSGKELTRQADINSASLTRLT